MNPEAEQRTEEYIKELEYEVALLKERVKKVEARNRAYQFSINKIDDWFEYMNESDTDRKKIHEILDNLTLRLNNNGV